MTRIAILADVHGNVPALEAVLDDLAGQQADEVLVGGDLVGRGPEGRAVVERIRALGLAAIRGNHEDLLIGTRAELEAGEGDADDDVARCTRWMAEELGDEAGAFVAALPDALVAATAPELRLVHGTPDSNREGIGPWTRADRLREVWDSVPEAVLCCAHTHRPLIEVVGTGLVVNVGSVGLPFDGDPRASYALLDRGPGGWRAAIRRVPYDRDALLARYRATGFLAAGGAMAELLALEIASARSHLVPFVGWCEAQSRPPNRRELPAFLAEFVPEQPVAQGNA